MSIFRFKKFSVVNERSAMKVNTDGVLLGAVMHIGQSDRKLLDIGTGTGTIALMAAQRLSDVAEPGFIVEAIDIDKDSAEEAAANFANSPWAGSLRAHHASLEEFASGAEGEYDLIFSNPPYFEDSLTAPDQRKSTARHTSDGLSYRDIFDFAKDSLSSGGRVAFVLPSEQEQALCRYGRMCGLHLNRITRVRTVPRKAPARMIAEFSRSRCENPEDITLTIQSEGKYTQEYLTVMRDFYLFA